MGKNRTQRQSKAERTAKKDKHGKIQRGPGDRSTGMCSMCNQPIPLAYLSSHILTCRVR